jgi:hypothetical protein
MRTRTLLTSALALGLVLATATAQAASLAGVTLPDQVKVGDAELVLNGTALRTKMMFKVYVAGLYIGAKSSDAAAIMAADAPRQMVMQFVRSVGANKVNEGWEEGLEANTPGASAALEGQFDTLMKAMEEVEDGSQLVFTYVPGTGTSITVKGKDKGTIPGKEFADALLACWLGPNPGPGADFKTALLGG